jgi:hypothetical protein
MPLAKIDNRRSHLLAEGHEKPTAGRIAKQTDSTASSQKRWRPQQPDVAVVAEEEIRCYFPMQKRLKTRSNRSSE